MWKRIGSDITPWTSEPEWQRVLATLTGSKDRRGSSFVRRKIWGHWGIYASGYTDDRYQWHLELQEWSSLSWRGSSRATELEVMEESRWIFSIRPERKEQRAENRLWSQRRNFSGYTYSPIQPTPCENLAGRNSSWLLFHFLDTRVDVICLKNVFAFRCFGGFFCPKQASALPADYLFFFSIKHYF